VKVYSARMVTCSGGVATSEGTWRLKMKVRGLAVFAAAHTHAVYAVCAPGLTPRLGLSSWPARYPHVREMLPCDRFVYQDFSFPCINSLKRSGTILDDTP
jgi:hypothetical protein